MRRQTVGFVKAKRLARMDLAESGQASRRTCQAIVQRQPLFRTYQAGAARPGRKK